MKLQILIPQYKETDEVIKPMLDSLVVQQNVEYDDFGVIICNDGSDVKLSESFLKSYPFDIQYYQEPHRGVSGTRNACFDHATTDYVMFCDADDMFSSVCGLFIIMREIYCGGFDSLVSAFMEESRDPVSKMPLYINHDMDSTFVHGKVHKRQYLLKENIRWKEELTIHEDSYFNCLCQKLSQDVKYCPVPFYLWKWRDDSVCRHDPKYILKTYNNMLESNTCLVKEFERRKKIEEAQFYATSMIFDAYFTMNKDEWVNQENKEYRDKTEERFCKYFLEFKHLYDNINKMAKQQIIVGIKNRFFQEGVFLEKITFEDWIDGVLKKYNK